MNTQEIGAGSGPVAIRVKSGDSYSRLRFDQPGNLAFLERVASFALGFGLLYALGRRLLWVGGLAALAVYLLYRGLTGYCLFTAEFSKGSGGQLLSNRSGIDAIDPHLDATVPAGLASGGVRDKIDERSLQSFPASDA